MPLEMFHGKTGDRLIARLPVTTTSVAVISTDRVDRLEVYHPSGLVFNGYPALSPVLSSVVHIVDPVLQRKNELRKQYEEAYEAIEKVERKIEQSIPTTSAGEVLTGSSQAILSLHRATLDNTRPMVDKHIICTSIMIGRPMSLRLPKMLFEEVSVTDLGTVRSIEIRNN